MKLERLRTLQSHLEADLVSENISSSVYYFFEERWRSLDSAKPLDDGTTHALQRAKSEQIAYHAPSSLRAWYYFESSDCAIVLSFTNSPQLETRRRFRQRLDKVQEGATNAYKVSHHSLTHLLARDAFHEALDAAIAELGNEAPTSPEAQESGLPRTLGVMALDIDHFKQVNDTWGHLYGDQVLKTFGIRLERTATSITSTGIGKPRVFLGHPSGEEFLVLITANATRKQFADWANQFRAAIAEDVLPTDKEWSWLISQGSLGALIPPPLQDRTLTTSVGVALHTTLVPLESGGEPAASILDRADTALYRAKAAGRNQATFFDEILSSCGRVLEQDKTTRVVAIDIGSNVGVLVGQEFRAFPSTFSGRTKFTVNDGRTTRTLGVYPRVESARLVVFNAQPEISFAFIASPEDQIVNIEAGSHLEAIPVGSIGHLLATTSKYFPVANEQFGGGGLPNLQAFIKTSASGAVKPFAVVVRFTHEAEYLRKYGTATLNLALAKLYRAAQATFHAAKAVEVIDRGSICIAGPKAAYKESMVVEFINDLAAELPELGVYAGAFCEDDYKTSTTKLAEIALNPEHAVEFASFAASDYGRAADSRVRHFSTNTAVAVLTALREARSFETAYADFQRLQSLGVETPALLNLAGLTAGSLGKRKEAAEHYASAMTKAPSVLIYKSNFAVACNRLGDVEPALKVMNAIPLAQIDSLQTVHPYGYVAYARLLASAKLTKSGAFSATRFEHVAEHALGLAEADDAQAIRKAITSG